MIEVHNIGHRLVRTFSYFPSVDSFTHTKKKHQTIYGFKFNGHKELHIIFTRTNVYNAHRISRRENRNEIKFVLDLIKSYFKYWTTYFFRIFYDITYKTSIL